MKKQFLCLTLSLLGVIATACNFAPPTSRPDFVAIRPDPTLTPTTIATGVSGSTPTSVVSDQVSLSSYTHFTNRFKINYPANWQHFEKPDGVVFLDPDGHAGYSLFFSDVGKTYSKEELSQYLATFIAKNFAKKETGYAPLGQERNVNDSVVAQFTSTDPIQGATINEVRLFQRDTIVYVVYMSATKEQWSLSQLQLHRLTDSLTPLDTKPAVEIPPTDQPPVWILTGPTGNSFAFLYPSDWQITHQDESSVAVAMPGSNLIFEANRFDFSGSQTEAAAKAAQHYVDDLKKAYKDVQVRPAENFQLDKNTEAVTVDFLYTDSGGQPQAGSIITAADNGKIFQVVFSSAAEVYPFALQWFNPMYKSFRILPSDQVIQQP